MPTFAYRGKDASGAARTGTVLADNKRTALRLLEEMRVFPLEVEEKAAETGGRPGLIGSRVKTDEITDFLHQLADLLSVGVPFDRAMDVMLREAKRVPYVELLGEIKSNVGGGESLSQALARRPDLFGDLYVSMVSAGEEGGFLAETLRRIAELREKRKELRSKIQTALVYPIVLGLFGTATVIYLIVFFIPRFTQIFSDMGAALPASTRFLISVSEFAGTKGIFVAGALLGIGVLAQRWMATPGGRELRDRFLLRVPYLRDVILQMAMARVTRMLGTLLAAGVPILKSLEISRGAAGNLVLSGQFGAAALRVQEGAGLAEGLGAADRVPSMLKEKIAVGEETGRLAEVLVASAEQYEKALDRAVKLFVAVFEPALIFLMAGIVGFIVISMLLPIFTLNSMVQ